MMEKADLLCGDPPFFRFDMWIENNLNLVICLA
jgi:hypothetical protein